MTAYERALHRVQTAIAVLMGSDPDYAGAQPKHLRVGIDMSKSDHGALAGLLIKKGVFTLDEYVTALEEAAIREAEGYEKSVQAVLGNRNIKTL